MAKVVFSFEDLDSGETNVNVDFEPELPENPEEMTGAQIASVLVMGYINELGNSPEWTDLE